MTKLDPAFRNQVFAYVWPIFAAATILVYFFGLTIPLVGPDEPRYAQVAREMFERGDWITPTLGGFNWFEKPALLYWLQIGSYHLFGVSEFAARFGSALFGLGTIASLWILGKLATGADDREGDFANWLALIAATTIGIIVFSRGASFDIILTFPMTAALVGFFIYESSPADASRFRRSISLFALYFFVGLSLLAKGLVGVVFPAAIICCYYVLSYRFPDRRFILSLFWGTVVTLAVASTWYVPMFLRHGYAFIDEFFIQHHFQRYTSNKYFHPQPFYFFFWVLPLMTIPWLPFFLVSVWRFGMGMFSRRDNGRQSDDGRYSETPDAGDPVRTSSPNGVSVPAHPVLGLLRFAFAWMLVPLVFFSFSGSKLPGYILPAVPAAVIFAAACVAQFVSRSRARRSMIFALAFATYVVVVGAIIFVVPKFADGDSVKGLIAAADERGYSNSSVLSLHAVSHNAEFYAAGRLVRDPDGRQRKFLGPLEILDRIRRENGRPVLVLVPPEYLKQLTENPNLVADVIAGNDELAIVAARER